ncbi:hypothetical protein ACFPRL_02450 [Pseudoclavibacter helvolus]
MGSWPPARPGQARRGRRSRRRRGARRRRPPCSWSRRSRACRRRSLE